MVNSFFHRGKLPKGISSSFMMLIPKKRSPRCFSEFKSINLINRLYKIIAKLLSSILKYVLTSVISVS
jgi:hypothetical protein